VARNEIYVLETWGSDLEGNHILGKREYMCYTCGHCSTPVLMNPGRERPRKTCLSCGRWVCEQHEICMQDCTPIYSLADNHFEDAGKWSKWVKPIMHGATSVAEAEKLII
jgi:hypothetical protein